MIVDPGVLELFVLEVDRQAEFGLMAADDLCRALTNYDTDRVWYSIQSLLVATANVSKLLWPKSDSSVRGDTLRRTLRVDNDSPLKSKKFRNHFEHFDERLEKWGISPQTHMVVDSNIGSLGSIKVGKSSVYVRNYDPSTQTLTFHGDVYELRTVIEALEALRSVTAGAQVKRAGSNSS